MRGHGPASTMGRFLRYSLVGAVATATHYGLLVAGVALAGWPAWLSAGLGAACGALVAYFGNCRFTFFCPPLAAGRWLRFQLTAVITTLCNMALVALAVVLGWHYLAGQLLATAATLLLGFAINRRWAFA